MSYLRFCNSICLWEVSCLIYVSVTAFVCGRSQVSCLIYVSVTAFVCGRSHVLFTFL